MKPNPVKKMVEYCSMELSGRCDHFRRSGHNSHCDRYNREIGCSVNAIHERPTWCTDETFVRVEIEPVVYGGDEYCYHNGGKCKNLHQYSWDNDMFYCHVINLRWIDKSLKCLRLEACRKLEVE